MGLAVPDYLRVLSVRFLVPLTTFVHEKRVVQAQFAMRARISTADAKKRENFTR